MRDAEVESMKPVGTGVVCVNCGSEATESIRNKIVPAQLALFVRALRAAQFPSAPARARGWPTAASLLLCRRLAPAEIAAARTPMGRSALCGSSTARTVSESRSTKASVRHAEQTLNDSSGSPPQFVRSAEICRDFRFQQKRNFPSSGSSSWLPRLKGRRRMRRAEYFCSPVSPSGEALPPLSPIPLPGRL